MPMLEKAEVSQCTKWPIITPNSIHIGEVRTTPLPPRPPAHIGSIMHQVNDKSAQVRCVVSLGVSSSPSPLTGLCTGTGFQEYLPPASKEMLFSLTFTAPVTPSPQGLAAFSLSPGTFHVLLPTLALCDPPSPHSNLLRSVLYC